MKNGEIQTGALERHADLIAEAEAIQDDIKAVKGMALPFPSRLRKKAKSRTRLF